MRRFFATVFGTLLLAAALSVTPVSAQETAAKTSEQSDENSGMFGWKLANFAILFFGLAFLIKKNMGPMLVARSAQIREGLAAGERAKADADARAAAVQAKLAGLATAVSQLKADSRRELDREATRIQQDTTNELNRIQQQALLEIQSAGKLARMDLQRYAAKLALDLAEQKVRARMSSDMQSALIQNFLGEMNTKAFAPSREN